MERSNLPDEEYHRLLEHITDQIYTMGLKSATMENVAKSLGMSKRTLYEIFESKDNMITEALEWSQRNYEKESLRIIAESDNVIEAGFKIGRRIRETMSSISPDFFRDMDRLYTGTRELYERKREQRQAGLLKILQLGEKQGVVRGGLDLRLHIRLLDIQLESVKRFEEHFPDDISMAEANYTIMLSFIRSIASPKGMEVVDRLNEEYLNEINYKTPI